MPRWPEGRLTAGYLPLARRSRLTGMADKRAFVRRVSVMEQGWRLPIGEDGVIRRLGAREQTLGIWETNRAHRGERGHDLPQTCSCKGRVPGRPSRWRACVKSIPSIGATRARSRGRAAVSAGC